MKGLEKRNRRRDYSFYGVAVFALLVFIWYALTISSEDMRFDSEDVYEIRDGWICEYGGLMEEASLPVSLPAQEGEPVRFRTILEEQEQYCNSIMFHSQHQYVKVYLDGTLLTSYGENQTTPIPMSPGSPWLYVRLPADWIGKELVIETEAVYASTAGCQDMVYLGTKNALVFLVIKRGALAFLLTMPIMLAGLLMLLGSFFLHDKDALRKMRYTGLLAMTAGLWILLESRIMQLFMGSILLTMNMIFILFGLIPIIVLYYLQCYPVFRESSYMRAISSLSVVGYIVIQLLRVFGIVDYMYSVPLVHGIMILGIAGIMAIYIKGRIRGIIWDREVKSLFAAVFVLAGFGGVDMLRFYIMPVQSNAVIFSRIGLFCFVVILGHSALRKESEEQERQIERRMLEKLAYTDMLTGLQNRTAFEEKMDRYRKGEVAGSPLLMVTDINGLKFINDNFGHKAGDEAIELVAVMLEKVFGEYGDCYRIGGDEFCVISERLTEKAFADKMERYLKETSKLVMKEGYGVSAAAGMAQCAEDGVDQAFIKADSRMYECKTAMKRKPDGE